MFASLVPEDDFDFDFDFFIIKNKIKPNIGINKSQKHFLLHLKHLKHLKHSQLHLHLL